MDFSSRDYSALFFKILRLLKINFKTFLCSYIMTLQCRLKNIKIGYRCIFNGLSVFYRRPSTKIIIGNNCQFISDFKTNLVGVNRKCIIATHADNAVVSIGNYCGFSGTVIGSAEKIIIGNDVFCGANTLITDFDWHSIDPELRRTGKPESAPVIIEDNVWLGINVVVLKGVKIGKNSVIGANSLVNKDIPSNVVAAGNPCRIIKELTK